MEVQATLDLPDISQPQLTDSAPNPPRCRKASDRHQKRHQQAKKLNSQQPNSTKPSCDDKMEAVVQRLSQLSVQHEVALPETPATPQQKFKMKRPQETLDVVRPSKKTKKSKRSKRSKLARESRTSEIGRAPQKTKWMKKIKKENPMFYLETALINSYRQKKHAKKFSK